MLVHDIAIDHLHAVFCVDRAGLVGDDGETHHGLFDPGFLQTIPGITVLSPASLGELSDMLNQAVHHCNGPVAVRYPRGGETQYHENHSGPAACVLREGEDLSLGSPGEGILAAVAAQGIGLKNTVLCSCGEGFIPHGTVSQLRAFCGLDVESLYQKAREVVRYGRKETTGCSAH